MNKLYSLLFLGILWLFSGRAVAQTGKDFAVIRDFSNEWLMFDYDEKAYVPFEKSKEEAYHTYTLDIPFLDYPQAFLVIQTPSSGANVFFNHKLQSSTDQNKWLIYNLEQLKKEYKDGNLYVTLFSTEDPSEVTAFIGYPTPVEPSRTSTLINRDVVKLLPREVSHVHSGAAFAFVLSIIMLSLLSSNYFRVYEKYYSLSSVFSSRLKDDLFLLGRPMDRPSILFIILLSLVVGFIILLIKGNSQSFLENSFLFQSGSTFFTYSMNFIKLCLLIFVIFVLKYFFISLVGKLFNLSKIADIHFFKEVQITLLTASILLIILLILFNFYILLPQDVDNYLFIFVIAFFVLRAVLIYFAINREANTKFLYIFSYLCIAEALPIIIGMQFLF